MFEYVEGPKWPLRRPERSGVIAIWLFFLLMTVAISFAEKGFFAPSIVRSPSESMKLLEPRKRHPKKLQAPEVEIQSFQPAPSTSLRTHPRPCQCHIDTRAPEELIHHHASQFAMCNLISGADKQWHKGYFAGEAVEIRWHCNGE